MMFLIWSTLLCAKGGPKDWALGVNYPGGHYLPGQTLGHSLSLPCSSNGRRGLCMLPLSAYQAQVLQGSKAPCLGLRRCPVNVLSYIYLHFFATLCQHPALASHLREKEKLAPKYLRPKYSSEKTRIEKNRNEFLWS